MRRTRTESRAETLDLKRLNLDALVTDGAKHCQSLIVETLGSLAVKTGSCSEVVNTGVEKTSLGVKQIESNELAPGVAAASWTSRSGEEKLATIGGAPDVLCVVIVVLNRDEFGWFAWHNGV